MEPIKRFTFEKAERLTNKILISKLFSEGNSFICRPFRVVWKQATLQSEFPAQIVISVSKRNFKKAVTRNLLKRRVREIYRKNKCHLYDELNKHNVQIAFMVIYLPDIVMKTSEMEDKLVKALQRIPTEYEKHTQHS